MTLLHISFYKVYKLDNLVFEFHQYLGPTPLRRKDLEPMSLSSMSLRKWATVNKFVRLNNKDREKLRIV